MDIVVVTSVCVHIYCEYEHLCKSQPIVHISKLFALNSAYIICEVPNLISTFVLMLIISFVDWQCG